MIGHRPNGGSLSKAFSTVTAVLFVGSTGLAAWGLVSLAVLRAHMEDEIQRLERQYDALANRLGYDTRRTRLTAALGDAIHQLHPEMDEAATYAVLVLEASEKYRVDPLLLVSVGIVESGYDASAVSHAGARGLYQIHPETGRMLARGLGWEYSESLLHDPAKNTELAANYLGLLSTAYEDVEMMLAEYNGGPLNAGYFRANADELAEETRKYVPRVLDVYERLESSLGGSRAE